MRIAPFAADENSRLDAVAEYEFASGPSVAPDLDQFVKLAKALFGANMAVVSFVERERQIFLAKVGVDVCETGRDISFCSHAIRGSEVFVVLDATLDPRFASNALVLGPPKVRFYAGAPLIGPTGHAMGTICIFDVKPRAEFSPEDRAQLAELAALVMDKLELRRLEIARSYSHARFEAAAHASPDGVICTDKAGAITFWNAASERLFGYSALEVVGRDMLSVIAPANQLDPMALGVLFGGDNLSLGRSVELPAVHADGREFPIELSLKERTEGAAGHLECILRDVTGRHASEDRLYKLAHYDPLTELPNRTVLNARLDAVGQEPGGACLLSIDLDGFKEVNDTYGHLTGDALLKAVAKRLLACGRSEDTVARMGGDEFVMLLPGISDPTKGAIVADRIVAAVAEDFVIDEQSISVGASVGFAIHPAFGQDSGDLISNADLALYQAKAEGRHCRRMFVPALRERASQRRNQDYELRRAHERGEFEIYYQPQVRLADGALLGAEALLRWNHVSGRVLSPAAFLANLEQGPMAAPVGNWVLANACAQAAQWRSAGAPDFLISVNLFMAQFRTSSLSDQVQAVLASAGLPPQALELEITENIILRQDDEITAPLRLLKDLGVRIAFDDYGTGYASLSMLKTVPLTRLKLDQSFVRGMGQSEEDEAIVHAVLYLGNRFNLEVIAEGVETEDQRQKLKAEGCKEAQGYLFGHPMRASEFASTYGLERAKPALAGTSPREDHALLG